MDDKTATTPSPASTPSPAAPAHDDARSIASGGGRGAPLAVDPPKAPAPKAAAPVADEPPVIGKPDAHDFGRTVNTAGARGVPEK